MTRAAPEVIDCTTVLSLIEQQKQLALDSPIIIIGNESSVSTLRPLVTTVSEIYNYSLHFEFADPSTCASPLTTSVHRTLVFFFFRSDSAYHKTWLNDCVAPAFEDLPLADLYGIDMANAHRGDGSRLKTLGIEFIPCAIVYRMGHQIDKIYPEIEEGIVAVQVAEYKEQLNQIPIRLEERRGRLDDDEFADQLREREIMAQRKENVEKMKQRQKIKARIAEDQMDRAVRLAPA
jgi:hypothetical protein